MSDNFLFHNPKMMVTLNVLSVIVTAICEVFVIYVFFTKGLHDEIVSWKFGVIIAGLVIVSLMFVLSVIALIYFFKKQRKKNHV
jgi:hypothetical protein